MNSRGKRHIIFNRSGWQKNHNGRMMQVENKKWWRTHWMDTIEWKKLIYQILIGCREQHAFLSTLYWLHYNVYIVCYILPVYSGLYRFALWKQDIYAEIISTFFPHSWNKMRYAFEVCVVKEANVVNISFFLFLLIFRVWKTSSIYMQYIFDDFSTLECIPNSPYWLCN